MCPRPCGVTVIILKLGTVTMLQVPPPIKLSLPWRSPSMTLTVHVHNRARVDNCSPFHTHFNPTTPSCPELLNFATIQVKWESNWIELNWNEMLTVLKITSVQENQTFFETSSTFFSQIQISHVQVKIARKTTKNHSFHILFSNYRKVNDLFLGPVFCLFPSSP